MSSRLVLISYNSKQKAVTPRCHTEGADRSSICLPIQYSPSVHTHYSLTFCGGAIVFPLLERGALAEPRGDPVRAPARGYLGFLSRSTLDREIHLRFRPLSPLLEAHYTVQNGPL